LAPSVQVGKGPGRAIPVLDSAPRTFTAASFPMLRVGAVMIAAAIPFDSGILLFADTDQAARDGNHQVPSRISPRQYGSSPGGACSVLVASDPVDWSSAAFHRCERALESMRSADCTIDRMRATIEDSLFAVHQEWIDVDHEKEPPLFVALYSPGTRKLCVFRTSGTVLQEINGYDCQGSDGYLGHFMLRDRYHAARSVDRLDLTTVFSMAADTLRGVREADAHCGPCSEMVVMYADGRMSDVQVIPDDSHRQRTIALTALTHSSRQSLGA
jgi:hypothetical protein